jgi:hypothetical protein
LSVQEHHSTSNHYFIFRPLRGFHNDLEDFEDEPVYGIVPKEKLRYNEEKKKLKPSRKANMPKKSIIQFLDELASES